MWKLLQIFFSWALKPLKMVTATMKLKDTCSLKESYDKPRQCNEKQRHHFADSGPNKVMVFPIVMYRCEIWTTKKAECWGIDAFEMILNCGAEKTAKESPDSKEIKTVNSKGNQPWIFTGRTDAEAETPIFWPPDEKSRVTGKDPEAGKDWGKRRRGQQRDG